MGKMEALPGRLVKLRRLVNDFSGLDIVKSGSHHNLRAHLDRLFELYDINVVLDVGANEGQFGHFLRKTGYAGSIYSFEPVKQAFNILSTSAKEDENWHVFNFALGSEAGEAEINVSEGTCLSSMLPLSDYALDNWKSSKVEYREKIVIKTIDQCVHQGVVPDAPLFLKMDTQGFDLEVFKGGRESVRQIKAILSEVSFIALYEGAPDYKTSISTFERAGFRVSGMYPVTRNADLSLNEMDCILIKSSSLN
jgi:FkbM family methyltransferase